MIVVLNKHLILEKITEKYEISNEMTDTILSDALKPFIFHINILKAMYK